NSGNFSGVDVRDAKLAARVQDGLLVVDSMRARTLLGSVTGAGSIGMTESARGALRFAVNTDSIMPLDGTSTGTPMSGSIAANGTLVGGLGSLELEAMANVRSFLLGGVAVKKSLVRINGRDLATDSMQIQLSA